MGKVKIPIKIGMKEFEGILLIANDTYQPDTFEVQTTSTGHSFVEWDTQYIPNGIYDIHLEIVDGENKTFCSATNSVTVSNLVSFDLFTQLVGDQKWFFARLAVPLAKWEIKVYEADHNKYLGSFVGMTTNGLINFIWDLKDAHGKLFTNDDFREEYFIKPLTNSNLKTATPLNHPKPGNSRPPHPGEAPRRLTAPVR